MTSIRSSGNSRSKRVGFTPGSDRYARAPPNRAEYRPMAGDPSVKGYMPRVPKGPEGTLQTKVEVVEKVADPENTEPEVDDCILFLSLPVPTDYLTRGAGGKTPSEISVARTLELFRREVELFLPLTPDRRVTVRLDGGWKYEVKFPDSLDFQNQIEVEMKKLGVGVVWRDRTLATLFDLAMPSRNPNPT